MATKKRAAPKKAPQNVSDLVRKKAYEIWEKNGRKPGTELDNWLIAERVIKRRSI